MQVLLKKKDSTAHRKENIERVREYDKKRGNRQGYGYVKKYRKSNKEKYSAHKQVGNAVRDGRLKKQPCLFCGSDNVVGHHPDYSKPLDVVWLCQSHHQQVHVYEKEVEKIRAV